MSYLSGLEGLMKISNQLCTNWTEKAPLELKGQHCKMCPLILQATLVQNPNKKQ